MSTEKFEVKRSHELTATGAFSASAELLQLNHASTAIAATLAEIPLCSMRVISDSSSGGTAAHTVTLGTGTFDGTNNRATLNAPGEVLVVYGARAGHAVILENIGSVALSSV